MHEPTPRPSNLRRLLLLAASLGVGAVGWFLLGEPPRLGAEESGRKVLARVGDETITESEILDKVAGQLLQLDRQRHQLIAGALDDEIRQRIFALEAAKKGVDTERLLAAEVDGKLAAVAQEEVDAFYASRNIRQPKEAVEYQIRRILAADALQQELEKQHPVEILLEPFRVKVEAQGPSKGPDAAPVTIVAFSDFECPYCNKVTPAIEKVHEEYGDRVRIVFRQFPLDRHPHARQAGEASLCAEDQGYFWQMHDLLFAGQSDLSVDSLKQMASSIDGLDDERFASCLDSKQFADAVERDVMAGTRAGVSSTPAFFVNGRPITGAADYEAFAAIIDDELDAKRPS